jgi:peptidoglycan/xylan/chitin deacetylase (PgdA/CDA1 family)
MFTKQIDYLQTHYVVLSMVELAGHVKSGLALPSKAALLTFDDGFADHYDYVLPVLHDRRLSGCFYPPAAPIMEHRLLDVHKIHFLLAAGPNPVDICVVLDDMIVERSLGDLIEYTAMFRHPSPRDSAEVIYLKRMLQKGLPTIERGEIVSALFERFVTVDERAFAEELYCDIHQLQLMNSLGMHIGSHGYEHLWLSTLEPQHQQIELKRSLDFLSEIYDLSTTDISICYPYGDHNETTRKIAHELGFLIGFADHHGIADFDSDDILALPRVSTSDFLLI